MIAPAGKHSSNRLIEWLLASIMLGIALTIVITPQTISHGAFRYILLVPYVTPHVVAAFFGYFSVVRLVALYLNGQIHPYSAHMRFVGSLAGAISWSLMALALAYLSTTVQTVSTGIPIGIPVYCGLVVAEIFSCMRAGHDLHVSPDGSR